MIAGSVVDWGALGEVVWVSALAATLLTVAVSLAILGTARANSERREGNATAASLYGALALLAAVAVAGGVVLGVTVMLSKS